MSEMLKNEWINEYIMEREHKLLEKKLKEIDFN